MSQLGLVGKYLVHYSHHVIRLSVSLPLEQEEVPQRPVTKLQQQSAQRRDEKKLFLKQKRWCYDKELATCFPPMWTRFHAPRHTWIDRSLISHSLGMQCMFFFFCFFFCFCFCFFFGIIILYPRDGYCLCGLIKYKYKYKRHIFDFFVISRTMTWQGRSENSDQSGPLHPMLPNADRSKVVRCRIWEPLGQDVIRLCVDTWHVMSLHTVLVFSIITQLGRHYAHPGIRCIDGK